MKGDQKFPSVSDTSPGILAADVIAATADRCPVLLSSCVEQVQKLAASLALCYDRQSMKQAFLLRFREQIGSASTDAQSPRGLLNPLAGTQTVTKIAGEGGDPDPRSQSFRILPHGDSQDANPLPLMGTQTYTEVKGESGDPDPKCHALFLIPRG